MGLIGSQQEFGLGLGAFVKVWANRRAFFAHIFLICPEVKNEGISSSLWRLFHFENWCFFVLIYFIEGPLDSYKPFFMRSSLIHLALGRSIDVNQACCFISNITRPRPEWFLLVQVDSRDASNLHLFKHLFQRIYRCFLNKVLMFQLWLTLFLRTSVIPRLVF